MSDSVKKANSSRWPVMLTIALVGAVAIVFAVAFIAASQSAQPVDESAVTEDTYMDIVTPLLEDADPQNGEELVMNQFPCVSCHVMGGDNIAPKFDEIAEHAAAREPLQLEAYIYEAIVTPHAHIVEGYPNSMPNNYGTLLSDEQLGDMIAYLLTVAEGSPSS